MRSRWDMVAVITIAMAAIMAVPPRYYTSHAAKLRTTSRWRAMQEESTIVLGQQEAQSHQDHLNEGSDEISAQDLEEAHVLEVLEDKVAHSSQMVKDPTECIDWPMLHSPRAKDNSPVNEEYIGFHRNFQQNYEESMKPGTLKVSPDEMFTKTFENYVDFVYWGFAQTVIKMSLFTDPALYGADHKDIQALEGDFRVGNTGFKWLFVHPNHQANSDNPVHNMNNIHGVHELEGDYIAFIGNNAGSYQHFLLDHLGYIAFFRKTMPPTTKLLIADGPGHEAYRILRMIDPNFADNRVHYLQCSSFRHCNQHVKIRNNIKVH
jgi:hypothetical protein